jgi:hypothetical protein
MRLPRRHRHTADRQRRDEQQRHHAGERGPDRDGTRGIHAPHPTKVEQRRTRVALR